MRINGEVSDSHECVDCCICTVEFKTNGFQGGDRGHGGFLAIAFKDQGGTSMEATTDRNGLGNDTITLTFRGDAEMRVAVECFEFLAEKLRYLLGDPTREMESVVRRAVEAVDERRQDRERLRHAGFKPY
jgi:hypothetical protein